MKTLSKILENKNEKLFIESINTKSEFKRYVHEKFSQKEDYNKVRVSMIIESVLDSYPKDFEKAIDKLENF